MQGLVEEFKEKFLLDGFANASCHSYAWTGCEHEICYFAERNSISNFQRVVLRCATIQERGVPTVLSAKEEPELVRYLLLMCDRGLGLTPALLKLKIYEITRTRVTPFKNGIPGDGWLRWFKRRHPELELRVAEALSSTRAKSLCPENV